MTQQIAQQVTQHPWATIITSWLGSGALSALVAGMYNLRAKRNEYVNDYYKIVITSNKVGAFNLRVADHPRIRVTTRLYANRSIDLTRGRSRLARAASPFQKCRRNRILVTAVLPQRRRSGA